MSKACFNDDSHNRNSENSYMFWRVASTVYMVCSLPPVQVMAAPASCRVRTRANCEELVVERAEADLRA